MRKRLVAILLGCAAIVPPAAAANAGTHPAVTSGMTSRRSPIKHVVVLYLENHSFDNVLGFWCHDHRRRCPVGGMPSSVKLSNGAVVKPRKMYDVIPIVDHTVGGQKHAMNGGKMNGWEKIKGCAATNKPSYRCIGGYKPKQIPNLTSLATSFAISDHTFSMYDSPSFGGHLYAAMASLDGFTGTAPDKRSPGKPAGPGWGCNSDKLAPWAKNLGGRIHFVPSCVPDPSLSRPHGGAFERTPVKYAPTIFDRLQAAHRTWRIYGKPNPGKDGNKGYVWDICPDLAQCLYTSQRGHNVPSDTFIRNARAGTLPNFSIIVPGGKDARYSQHNGFSMIAGDNWIGKIASAVMNGPEWHSTALFITYDDCGCFYDQVPPGTNPDGSQQGPRVPVVIVSPYVKAKYTDSHATTYAGILAFTEKTFGLSPLGVNDAHAYGYRSAFNYSQAPLKPVRMVSSPVPRGEHIIWSQADQDT